MKPRLLTAALCCSTSLLASAQSGLSKADSLALLRADSAYRAASSRHYGRIAVRAHYDGTGVLLRWAPDAAGAWLHGNARGYRVERMDLGGGDGAGPAAAYTAVIPGPLTPLSAQGWKDLHQRLPDDMHLMVAGELIHQSMQPENLGFTGDFVRANQSFQERFGFAVLSADLSWPAAEGSALALRDNGVQPGRDYVYRVWIDRPDRNYPIDTGYVQVSTATPGQIPKPYITEVLERDSVIVLNWPRAAHERWFSAYWLERSADDGHTWQRRNKRPFVSFVNPELPGTKDEISYTDSIPGPYRRFQYRLIGITPFGLLSAPSTAQKAMGRDRTAPPSPTGVRTAEKKAGEITVTWDYPGNVADLKGFHIARGTGAYTGLERMTAAPLPKGTRSWVDKAPRTYKHNYYMVIAVDTADNAGMSLSAIGNVADSIPPATPEGITATMDSSGVVTLKWRRGKEPDLLGYYVYFRNQRDRAEARLTRLPHTDTVFTDTVSMRTLTKHAYYRVAALDMSENRSRPSGLIEVKRPDLIAPTAPIFTDYRVGPDGAWMKWAPSSSEDVARHVILRRAAGELRWDTLASITAANSLTYTDKAIGRHGLHEYAILAQDDARLWSPMESRMKLRLMGAPRPARVENLKAAPSSDKKHIELTWSYEPRDDISFVVYRGLAGGSLQRHKVLPKDLRAWKDPTAKAGKEYEYFIQVTTPNGRDSDYSARVKARLP